MRIRAGNRRATSVITYLCACSALLASFNTFASIIPNPVLPSGSDYVRSADGMQCSQAVSPTAYVDSGIYGNTNKLSNEYGIYARVIVPIGGDRNRPDCNRFFEFEMKYREQKKLLEGLKNEIFSN